MPLAEADLGFHAAECRRLTAELEQARQASTLPEAPAAEARAALDDLLRRLRGVGP